MALQEELETQGNWLFRHRSLLPLAALAAGVIGRYISFYNSRRPHMSIGYKTPEAVHRETGEQKCMWRRGKTAGGGDGDAKK